MDFIMYISSALAVIIVIYMLIRKADIKITLFGVGLALLFIAVLMGKTVTTATNIKLLAPFQVIIDEFKSILPRAGFIILILGGYTSYMSAIHANEVTVHALTSPLKKVKSTYVLVPIVFLLGNLLSLVVPSASNLAIILLATLFPVLKKAGMSTLTAAAVIATTATVMPTPLGGDNVAIATELAKYPEFAGLTTTEYVFRYHALISIPTLLVMAGVHYFWQKYMDYRQARLGVRAAEVEVDTDKAINIEGGMLYKTVYALLPIFPIVLLLGFYLIDVLGGPAIALSVEMSVIISFMVALVCELIRKRDNRLVLKETESFFRGMGSAFGIVALLVAATVFVDGLKGVGIIDKLQTIMQTSKPSGFVLPFILVILTAVIVILSGSGTALFYAMVPLMYGLAVAAGISAIAVTVPMGLAGNLLRAVSPVSAVVVIVAGSTKLSPIEIVKRTSIPMIVGVIFMFILSMIIFI